MTEDVSKVLNFLSETSLTEDTLGQFLTCLEDPFRATAAQILEMNPQREAIFSAIEGVPEKQAREYVEYYHDINARVLHQSIELTVNIDAHLPDVETFRKSEFFDWNHRQSKSSDILSIPVVKENLNTDVICIARDTSPGFYDESDIAKGFAIRSAVETNLVITRALGPVGMILDTLYDDPTHSAVFCIVDDRGRIVRSSASARHTLRKLVSRTDSRTLAFAGPQSALGRLLLLAQKTQATQTGSVRIDGQKQRVRIMPMTGATYRGAVALYVIQFLARGNDKKSKRVAQLTEVERNLVRALCEGASLREVAGARNVAYSTSRNQLANAHIKLGTRTIVDIARKYYPLLKR